MEEETTSAVISASDGSQEMGYAIKTCPICKEKLFADMDTCFNCMHRFEDGGSPEADEGASFDETIFEPEEPSWIGAPVLLEEAPQDDAVLGKGTRDLSAEFLIELHSFLGKFLLHRGIDIE